MVFGLKRVTIGSDGRKGEEMVAAYTGAAWIVLMVVAILFGWGSGTIARNKGYSFGLFFVIGFFLGLIGLIVALLIPRRTAPAPPPPV